MRRTLIPLMLVCALSAGCSYHVWSPPAQTAPIAGVGSLEQSEVRANVQVNGHAPLAAFDDRPGAVGGGLGLAFGLGEGLDLRLGGQALHLPGGGVSSLDRNLWSGRAALRYAPEEWIALSVGAGAGASAAGAFVSPDFGVTVGDGGEWVGFFFDVRVGVSVPIDPRTLDLTQPDDEEQHLATPITTAIVQLTPGMRFTLVSPDREEVGLVMRVTPTITMLADAEAYSFWPGGALGLELAFGAS